MDTNQLKQAANKVFADAVASFGEANQQSRAAAASALIKAAKDRGYTGAELHFVASCGMSMFGYGGGL